MVLYSNEYIADDINDLKSLSDDSAQSVIVLGAYVYENGQPCPMLADRILIGIDIYEAGLADTMLLSGDHGTKGYDEVNAMKTIVFKQGVPKDDVFLDHAGFSTYDSIIRAKKIYLVESAVISTQNYHLIRAVYIARKSGLEAYGIKADLRMYPKESMIRYTIREWMARVKDFIFIHIIKPEPKFLGYEIPITGSSEKSYDLPEDIR